MALNSRFVSIGKEQLHYFEWGSGSKLLLAFHGYGDDARVFYVLKEYLQDDYTIVSVDLPHHGQSTWPASKKFTQEHLTLLTTALKAAYKVDKISLAGYSLGGRIALALLCLIPTQVDNVILLAPDGLVRNYYYYFFTRTSAGQKLFRHMLEQPGGYLKAIDMLKGLKLADPRRHKFARYFLEEEDRRNFLLKVWPCMSELVPAKEQTRSAIKQHRLPVTIFMGVNDKIIPVAQARKFAAGLDTAKVAVLEKGHRLLDSESAPMIAAPLLK